MVTYRDYQNALARRELRRRDTAKFIESVWRCPEHEGCYTANHLSLADLRAEAAECAPTCDCWRHAVVRAHEHESGADA